MRQYRCRGFNLIELLVVIAILILVAGILLPALAGARNAARTAACGSNARQMAFAHRLYTDDHNGWIFPLKQALTGRGTLWWFGFEADGGPTTEGERILNRTRGRLWPYYEVSDSIEVCPAFALSSPHYKPKFTTNWTTYGHPLKLMNPAAPTHMDQVNQPSATLAFADSAQINVFQRPATLTNPMFEQWYYVSRLQQTVHYVHAKRANASMMDGHVRTLEPQFGLNEVFREAPVGRPPGDVVIQVN